MSQTALGDLMKLHFIVGLFGVIALLLVSNGPRASDSEPYLYSNETLTNPIFNAAEVAVRTAQFNNWLNQNHSKITAERLPQLREHLFYLIDSHVKNSFLKNATISPKEDLVMSMLFSWAEKLQVYGGNQIYNATKTKKTPEVASIFPAPEAYSIKLNDWHFSITPKTGNWLFKVPFYFMPLSLQEFTAANGQETQFVMVSTGVARHNQGTGYSQATLALMYTPENDKEQFQEFWKKTWNISGSALEKNIRGTGLKSYSIFDDKTKIHVEYTEVPTSNGSLAVVYSGIDGTFQHNRQHFIDFLNTIEVK